MDIVGNRKFVELPGTTTHELPPLLVRSVPSARRGRVMDIAADMVESEEMIPIAPVDDPLVAAALEHRRLQLAVNLVESYQQLLAHWCWGDSIVEWIRQCETTFETRRDLRNLLSADLWPHAGRSSFITLLEDKAVKAEGVELHRAVGLRLAFRQPPPIRCCSNQFLFYLNESVASTAYDTWARMSPDPVSSLPPERFSFEVLSMSLD